MICQIKRANMQGYCYNMLYCIRLRMNDAGLDSSKLFREGLMAHACPWFESFMVRVEVRVEAMIMIEVRVGVWNKRQIGHDVEAIATTVWYG